ncbi:MAG: hypothetical protein EBZ74_00805 [Planctomycetia bacterium]|nr:hypothetical protein [Planctomycetia bacterium]
MRPASREWLAGLRDRVAITRRDPGPAALAGACESTAAEAAAERMILAAHLVVWLENEWPPLLAERLATMPADADPDPAVVVTTSPVGITIVAETLGRDEPLPAGLREAVVAVTEREYRDWARSHPDPRHLLHVNHWTWLKTDVPASRSAEFGRFPLGLGESFWLHRTGTAGCGAERRACGLWKWNGACASLVEARFDERVGRL